MSSINYKNITPVSDDVLAKFDKLLANVDVAIPMSMAYIRKIQAWSFDQLEQRFQGVSKSTLRCYLQPSYQKMRPLHVVAAYSWLTMMPMIKIFSFQAALTLNNLRVTITTL